MKQKQKQKNTTGPVKDRRMKNPVRKPRKQVGPTVPTVRQFGTPEAAVKRRLGCDLTREEVAFLADVTEDEVCAWETCRTPIPEHAARAIDAVYSEIERRREREARDARRAAENAPPPAPPQPILTRIDEVNALFGKALIAYADLIRAEERERIARELSTKVKELP